MLAIQGTNPLGNVLHVIAGPETDLFTDIHGAAIMDITPILVDMDQEKPVFLSLTRCRHEPITEQMAKSTGMRTVSSFNSASDIVSATQGGAVQPQTEGVPTQPPPMQAPPPNKKAKHLAQCSYCKQKMELLPIPGFKICTACAQIEIGRNGQVKGKDGAGKDHTG